LSFAESVGLQADGKIVVGGSANGSCLGLGQLGLARYNKNGTLDSSFGIGGKVVTNIPNSGDAQASALVIQENGKIVAGGSLLLFGIGFQFLLMRYYSDGTPDLTFGTGGQVFTSFGSIYDQAFGLALQPDGRIVAVGQSSGEFAIARYLGDAPGPEFDICLQDDINGNLLQFNSTSGRYRFSSCRKGLILSGQGVVHLQGCKTQFTVNAPGRSILALANTCTHSGNASVQLSPQGTIYTIVDPDTRNNTCTCQ
jgi:uncharacterized delta-60 repeat protein